MAFASLEGLPDQRHDFGFGQVCATLANLQRRENEDPWRPDDFMPSLRRPEVEEPPAPDAETQSRLISALLGKKE